MNHRGKEINHEKYHAMGDISMFIILVLVVINSETKENGHVLTHL